MNKEAYCPAPLHVCEQARRLFEELEDIQGKRFGSLGVLSPESKRTQSLDLIEKYLRAASILPQTPRNSS